LVDHIVAAVRGEHPVYEQLRDQAGFRAAVSTLSHLYCTTVADDRRLSAKEAIALQVIGAQRARQGIAEEDMVGSVRTAMRAGWGRFTEAAADRCESPQQLQSFTARLFDHTDVFVADVLDALRSGFRAEDEQRLPGHLRAQATVVDRLVEGGWDDDQLFAFAREQGVPVIPPHAVLVYTGAPDVDGATLRLAMAELVGGIAGVVDGPVRMSGTPQLIAVVNEAGEQRVSTLCSAAADTARRHRLVAIVSPPVDRPSLLAEAYERSTADLAFAAAARPGGGLVGTDELRLYRLLSLLPPEARTELALDVLGDVVRLPPNRRNDLLKTFEAWLWSGSTKAAADMLRGVSVQTVRYRLRTLADVTGRDLHRPTDLALVQLAVRAFRVWVEPLDERSR
jgi:hypothetical protein